MFEWLSEFDFILVTGPQRSGTRICAKMISYDTGHEYVDEDDIGMDSIYRLCGLMETNRPIVVQCPVLCRYIHFLSEGNVAIIMMRRKVEDIIASQKRINWSWEWLELARYDRMEGVIAEIKYQFWDQYQKERIKHAYEIEFESLVTHPLWVTKDERHGFDARQTIGLNHALSISQNMRFIPCSNVYHINKLDQDSAFLLKTRENARLLNETGKFILGFCDGKHTRQNILKALSKEFKDISQEKLSSDLDGFLSDLISNGFLRFDVSEAARNGNKE